MDEMATDIPVSPEEMEIKTLCPVSINEVAVDIPVTPKKTEPRFGPERSKSFEGFRTSSPRVKVQARYLNASSSSCHDWCKYGRKNHLEDNASSVLLKRKKKPIVNSKPFSDSDTQPYKEPQVLTSKDKIDKSMKHGSDFKSKSMTDRSSSHSKPRDNMKFGDVILSGVGALQVSPMGSLSKGKKKELVPKDLPLSPRPFLKGGLSGKSQSFKDPKELSRLKSNSSVKKAEPEQPFGEKVREKTLYVVEEEIGKAPISEKKLLGSEKDEIKSSNQTLPFENKKGKHKSPGTDTNRSSLVSRKKSSGLKGDKKVTSKTVGGVKRDLNSEENGFKTSKVSVNYKAESKYKPKRVVKTGNEEKRDSTHKLSFKRGKIVDVELKNTAPKRLKFKPRKVIVENLNKVTVDEANVQKAGVAKRMPNPKLEINNKPKRVVKLGLEEKNDSTHKLNFEKGKVIDHQTKATPARRLKYKPRKVIVEYKKGKDDKDQRNLKKVVNSNEIDGSKTEALRVVLKHQNIEGKKDVQSLLNNVIEETATRLVRLRKSKVKALVGAFESLKSLPEASSSTTSGS